MAFINFKIFSLKNRGKGDLSDTTESEVELLSQYFEQDLSGVQITQFIEVTYVELLDLKTTSTLVPGQTYLLTDYETEYVQPTSNELMLSGVIEPLYILATDTNKLHNQCRSLLYPEDIVYYDVRNIHYGSSKGFIYRRIDTLKNNDIGTDWRHVKYRRWAVNVTSLLTIGTSYALGNIVTDLSGQVYVCTKNHIYTGVEEIPFWFALPIFNGDFVSYLDSGIRLRTSDTGPIIIPVDSNTFQDSLMFEIGEGNINNYIECRDIEELLYNTIIRGQFKNNRVTVSYFNHNTFWNFITNNIHANLGTNVVAMFSGNTVSSVVQGFSDNILNEVTENTFNGSFRNNISTGRLSRSDVQDFYGNTFEDLDWTLIKNFCAGNTFLSIRASEIGIEFNNNF